MNPASNHAFYCSDKAFIERLVILSSQRIHVRVHKVEIVSGLKPIDILNNFSSNSRIVSSMLTLRNSVPDLECVQLFMNSQSCDGRSAS